MLTHIQIANYTIIERLELDLGAGMTVLTGETGAGKSILVDALGLALGDRAESACVRPGADRAEVSAGFDLDGAPPAMAWLGERELDTVDGECLLQRSVTRDGRSKGYINGRMVPMQSLRELGELLVDIHGQHAHQALLRPATQRELLDAYGGHEPLVRELGGRYQRWRVLRERVQALGGSEQTRLERLDLLRYQLGELDEQAQYLVNLTALEQEHARLAHASELLESSAVTLQWLSDAEEHSVLALLSRGLGVLQHGRSLDERLQEPAALLEEAVIQCKEAATALRHYQDHLEMDPERLAWLEDRIAAIHDLARKHRVQPEELAPLRERLATELAELEGSEEALERLQQDLDAAAEDYRRQAALVSRERESAAGRLAAEVSERIRGLGMPGGRLEVSLTAREPDRFGPNGMESVELLVSANPGQPLQPLGKVASGGELSRISLATQVAVTRGVGVATLVFDEVDVGIGGRVAEIVGQQLRALAAARQVLCVTHLPQVAAQGHQHLKVEKLTGGDSTRTSIHSLSRKDRVVELARMLGGIEITEQTRAHAAEMLDRGLEAGQAS